MSFHNELEMYGWEYRQYLLKPKPLNREDGEAAHALWLKLDEFHRRAAGVLECFDLGHWRVLTAMLDVMPGSLDHMFESWLGHLRGLGLLEDSDARNL